MGIKVGASNQEVIKRLEDFRQAVINAQIANLQRLGEMCASHAKSVPAEQGFTDRTGNLRSSIGYAVFVDGVALHTSYEAVAGGEQGAKAGEELAQKVGKQYAQGVALVVTAGMNYAIYLEAKGRDVLTSAEHLAERELPRMLSALIEDIQG